MRLNEAHSKILFSLLDMDRVPYDLMDSLCDLILSIHSTKAALKFARLFGTIRDENAAYLTNPRFFIIIRNKEAYEKFVLEYFPVYV